MPDPLHHVQAMHCKLCSVPEDRFCASWLLGTQVIWDTAAYAPCHPINLAEVPADFICLSL